MICIYCKNEIPENSQFCNCCGKKLVSADDSNIVISSNSNVGNNDIAELLTKRNDIAVKDNDKKRKFKVIFIGLFIFIAIGVFTSWSIKESKKNAFNSQLRNMITEPMDTSYTNVYIDAVSIKPVYFIYNYRSTKSGSPIGDGKIKDVVCRCHTVEDKWAWAVISAYDYPDAQFAEEESDYKYKTYSDGQPLRLVGYADMAGEVIDELQSELGDIFVLDVRRISN